MKIKAKVIIYIIICMVISSISLTTIVTLITMNLVEKEEEELIQNNLNSTSLIINSEIQTIQRTQSDWSHWDDTYQFVQDDNEDFIAVNLGIATLKQLNLSGMVFLNNNREIIHSDYSLESNGYAIQNLIKGNAVNLTQNVTSDISNSGITQFDDRIYFISVAGITDSDGDAGINGYLIMIKELDKSFLTYMEELNDSKLTFIKSGETIANISYDSFSLNEVNRTQNKLLIQASIQDKVNSRAILLEMETSRISYNNALQTFKIIGVVGIVFLMISLIAYILIINQIVLKRILKLSYFVDSIIHNDNAPKKIEIAGKDEIANLAGNINNMLETLNKNFVEIKENDERLHLLMEATNDGYFDYNSKTGMVTISSSWLQHIGITKKNNQFKYNDVIQSILESDRELFLNSVNQYLEKGAKNFNIEIRVYKPNRETIWILVKGKVVGYDKYGEELRWFGRISDITERKIMEEENKFLLQTDPVTNLKNRAYMENIMKGLSKKREKTFCFLMADVNGLKLINDAFGHKEGDRLLSIVGHIFKTCREDTDIAVRWGGDEFLILIENDENYAEKLMQKIKNEFDLVDSFPIKINVAMGYSEYKQTDLSIDQAIKRAEEKMYRNKLLESRSIRNSIITSLEKTLHEKQIETYDHTNRVKEYCLKIGKILGLSNEKMDELALLSVLHDIGKIAIPDQIIMKSEELTQLEEKQYRIHAETGYRIAKTIPEISHIADKILTHHEYYDGTGYPNGYAKEQIPMITRILTVVHAWDSMISGYRMEHPMEKRDAIQRLRQFSGTKYDPQIVSIFIELIE